MQKAVILFFSLFQLAVSLAQPATPLGVTNLRCAYQINPVGIDATAPRLSWELVSQGRGVKQTAYRVLVADNMEALGKHTGNVWDSGKVPGSQSIQVPYAGKKLASAKPYYWKVMTWDNQGNASAWSQPGRWQMGLLSADDWKGARWIGLEEMPAAARIIPAVQGEGKPEWGPRKSIQPLLRKSFTVKSALKNATAFVSGVGHFELRLNGQKVGDHFLDPGWTDYGVHALYVTFDLTGQLKPGANALGVLLGNGFYHVPGERYRKLTGSFGYPKAICRLVLEYADGSTENIITDPSWKAAPGPVTFSSIYGGEDYDANLEQPGWDTPDFKDDAWKAALTVDGPPRLDAQMQAPVKIFENFTTQKITQPLPGVWVYDLGQNASAIPQLTVKGKKGATVRLVPSELLGDSGLVAQKPIGDPVWFAYTLKGEGTETWQPRFTYYGFRYVQIEGAVPEGQANPQGLPVVVGVKGLHVRNAAERAGEFASSNDLFNRTNKLIDWAIRSNMVSVLTDCPHREKLGWLEEVHLMGSSVQYNYNIATLCRKLIRDMQIAQTENGLVPDIAPEYVEFEGGFRDSPEWGSAAVILPWYAYQWYGDRQLLEESYPMMQRYVAYLQGKAKGHLLSHGLGDWYDIGPKHPGVSQLTPKGITATAIYYYDLTLMEQVAKLLGKAEDAGQYATLGKEVKAAFNQAFFDPAKRQYATGSQTANAMALYMNLVEPQHKEAVLANLIKDISGRNNSLTAGDIGYRYVLRVLENENRSDVIFDMNSRNDVPGYGYQLAHGATALTESWQAYRFVSNNHFMLGHLMEWFYSGLAGIRAGEKAVAFNEIVIRPEPVGDVASAQASYHCPYGLIRSEWKKNGGSFELAVQIPANTTATVYLPATASSKVSESGTRVENSKFVRNEGNREGRVVLSVGSGQYRFTVR